MGLMDDMQKKVGDVVENLEGKAQELLDKTDLDEKILDKTDLDEKLKAKLDELKGNK